jgi:signal transduction histidine kinase
MRYTVGWLLIVCLLRTVPACAQKDDTEQMRLVDSLTQRANMQLPDSELVQVYYTLGDYLLKSKPDEAKKYFDLSLLLSERLNNRKLKKRNLERIGVYFKDKGRFGIALGYQLKALQIAEQENDTFGIAVCCNNIGVVYKSMQRYSKAREYYLRSNRLCELTGKTQGYIMTLNNIGTTYNDEGDFKRAKPYYLKALAKAREIQDDGAVCVALNNLGEVYNRENNIPLALQCFKQCLLLDKKSGDLFGELLSTINIAGAEMHLNRLSVAEQYYLAAKELALRINGTTYLADIYNNLSLLYTKMGDHHKAYEQFKLHVACKDSIFNEENSKTLADLQLKYETEKKEQAIRSLNSEQEYKNARINMQKSVQYVSMSVGIILLLSLMGFYRLYLQRARTNEQLLRLDREKNEFLGIAAHDLKNPLQTIRGYGQMQKDYFDKLSRVKMLRYTHNIEISARSMVELISNLLDIHAIEQGHIKNHPEQVNLNTFLQQSIDEIRLSAAQKNITLMTRLNEREPVMNIDPAWLKQIADNLLSNAIKYAPVNGCVEVEVLQHENENGFSVSDNGAGISKEEQKKLFSKFTRLSTKPTAGESSNGLGLSIVKRLSEITDARIACESDTGKGCRFIFTKAT